MAREQRGTQGAESNAERVRAEHNPVPMGLHPERATGADSAAAGGVTERGLGGLKPTKLLGNERGDAVDELVEIEIDGSQVLVGVFDDQAGARRAIDALQAGHYDPNEIAVVYKDGHEIKRLTDQFAPGLNPFEGQRPDEATAAGEPEAERMEGQVAADRVSRVNLGTGLGLVAGALAGVAVGLAGLNTPGLETLLAGNGVAAAIGGAVLFGAIGAVGGSYLGVDTPAEDEGDYGTDLDAGYWLVVVRTNRIDQTFDLLRDAGARNFQEYEGGHDGY